MFIGEIKLIIITRSSCCYSSDNDNFHYVYLPAVACNCSGHVNVSLSRVISIIIWQAFSNKTSYNYPSIR